MSGDATVQVCHGMMSLRKSVNPTDISVQLYTVTPAKARLRSKDSSGHANIVDRIEALPLVHPYLIPLGSRLIEPQSNRYWQCSRLHDSYMNEETQLNERVIGNS